MELSEKTSWRMLSSFNARWYFHVMREMLIKYKVLSIFLIALLAPSVGFLLKIMTGPADIYLYSGRSNVFEFFVFLVMVQLFSMVFGFIHRAVLANRAWDGYINSLPVSPRQKVISDFITLTLANSLFLITIFYAYLAHSIGFGLHFVEISLRIIFLILMMYSIQLSMIYKRNLSLIFPVFLGLILAPLVLFLSMPIEVLAISTASYLLCCKLGSVYAEPGKTNRALSLSHFVKLGNHSQWYTLTQLNIKIMLNDIRPFFARVLPLIVLSAVFSGLMLNGGLVFTSGMGVLTLVLLLNMFFLSNIFKPIYNQWEEYRNYISSIPLSRFKFLASIFVQGLFFGVLVNLCLAYIFNIVFIENHALFELGAQVLISCFYLFYCFNLQIKFKRYGVLASFVGLVPFYYLVKLLT